MQFSTTARVASLAACALGILGAPAVRAQEASVVPTGPGWEINLAPLTVHYHSDPAHKPMWLVGLERHRGDGWLWGGAFFSNSFGQECGAVLVGYEWNNLFDNPRLYAKLLGGIMYGYVAPYEDKVPFNHNGFSPALVPSLGWRLTAKDSLSVSMLGTAALMFSYNRRF